MFNIMMTVDSLFLPKAALLSIHLLLKPFSSKFLISPSTDKKNSCAASRSCTNDALSLVFFQPITARLFPISNHSFFCALHSDDLLDKSVRRKASKMWTFQSKQFLSSVPPINWYSEATNFSAVERIRAFKQYSCLCCTQQTRTGSPPLTSMSNFVPDTPV